MTLAGISAMAAGVTLLVSGACLVVFFGAGKDAWGRANDATTALFALLMFPPAFELYERYAPSSRWVMGIPTLLRISGLLVVAATSGMTAAAKLDWLVSAKIGGVGLAGFLAWMGAVCVLILGRGGLPEALAWFGFVALGIALVVAVLTIAFIRTHGGLSGEVQPPAVMWGSVRTGVPVLPGLDRVAGGQPRDCGLTGPASCVNAPERHTAWVRAGWESLRPHSTGVYANFVSD